MSRPPLSFVPLVPPVVAFIIGIVVGQPVAAAVCVAGTVVAMALRRTSVAILLVAAALGSADAVAHRPQPWPPGEGRSAAIAGEITEIDDRENSRRLVIDVDSVDGRAVARMKVIVHVPSEEPPLALTDMVALHCRLEALEAGSARLLPDEPDADAMLLKRGVVARGFVSPDSIRSLGAKPGLPASIVRLRPALADAILRTKASEGARRFLVAVMTGDDSLLDDGTRRTMSMAGVAHVLALSGMHVGIVTAVMAALFFPLAWTRFRRLRWLIIIIALWAFAVMTGLGASVTRAVVMATLLLAARCMERRPAPLNSLAAAAFITLLFDPGALFMPGFQLSYIAVLSIIIFVPLLLQWVDRRNRRVAFALLSFPTVTLAATLGTAVVTACWFHIFPVYFLVTNLVIAILLPVIAVAAVVMVACGGLTGLVDGCYRAMMWLTGRAASWPGAEMTASVYPSAAVVVLYFMAVAALAWWLHGQRRAAGIATAVLSVSTVIVMCVPAVSGDNDFVLLTGDHTHTAVLVREPERLVLFLDAPEAERDAIAERYADRCRDYVGRRGLDSLTVADGRWAGVPLIDDAKIVRNPGADYEYVVVAQGFRGDVKKVAEIFPGAQIILASNLNKRRHDRYRRELTEIGRAPLSLRNGYIRLR